MTRRIPPAFGLVIVIAGVHALYTLVPLFAMAGPSDLPWWFALMLGSAFAQLASGIAISVSSRHARPLVAVWTVLALATFIFARDALALETGFSATIVVFAELVAGPVIAWLVPFWIGDAPTAPAIPRAHLVSSTHPGDAHQAPDLVARRFDLGVVLFGVGIVWFLGTIFGHLATLAMLVSDGQIGGLLGELVFTAQSIATGILAIVAARRLLDPSVDPRRAVRAVAIFAIVAIAGNVIRTALSIGYQVYSSDLSSDIEHRLLVQWSVSALLGLITPLFYWWYARTTLGGRAETAPSPSRLASVPAWAMLWVAPSLLTRVFVVDIVDTSEISSGMLRVVGLVCALEGVLFVIAAIATFTARRLASSEESSAHVVATSEGSSANAGASISLSSASSHIERSLRIARICAVIAFVLPALLIAVWLVAVFGMDLGGRFRFQAPVGPLVNLVACAATMWWVLRRR